MQNTLKTQTHIRVVGISGPSGAGKDYLTEKTIENLGVKRVSMVTTRPAHTTSEGKICIDETEYDALLKKGLLIGHHLNRNTGYKYGYRISDFKSLDKPAIIELNPMHQVTLKSELEKHGIQLAGWIGIIAQKQYLIDNITSRQTMPEDVLKKRLAMSDQIMSKENQLHKKGIINILFGVGWHNRTTMASEFSKIVEHMLN